MANEYNKTAVMSALSQMITLKQWAERNGHDAKHVRRLARTGKLPSAFQFGDRWYMPKNATDNVPEPKTRGGSTRTDGRKRYIVIATQTEIDAVTVMMGNATLVINPRDVAKQRRDDKRLNDERERLDES